MNNTPTPRTDEWLAEEKRNPRISGLGNWLDYCKILERELTAVTEQRDRLAEACSPSFDTTETDAAWSAHCIDPDSASGDPWDLAKKLETELTAVTEQRDGLRSGIDYASDQLTRVTEQRDRLIEALERIADYQGRFAEEDPESIAAEALQSLKEP